jgi:hypothetical protein
MPTLIDSLFNFSGGELTPKLDARIDLEKYRSGLRQCQNMIPYKQGGLTRRPGTLFKAKAKYANVPGAHNYAVETYSFNYSPGTAFALEIGHQYIRFYSNRQQVVVNSATQWVSNFPYAAGSYVSNLGIIYYTATGVTSATPPAGDPNHWVAQTILEVPTPYNGDAGAAGSIFVTDVFQLTLCQINDVVYFDHPNYPVYKLTSYSNTNWVFQPVAFYSPALLDQNATDTTIQASALQGVVNLTATAPAWVTANYYLVGQSVLQGGLIYNCLVTHVSGTFATDLANALWGLSTIFVNGHIGSTWQLAYLRASAYVEVDGTAASGFTNGSSSTIMAMGDWEVHTYGVWSSDIAILRSLDGGNTWDTVRTFTGRSDRNVDIKGTAAQLGMYKVVITNSAALVNAGATNPRVIFECVDSFLYGLVQITGVSDGYHAVGNVLTQLSNTNATEYWSEGAWSTYRGFPAAVCTYQQRMIYGGSAYQPQRIWATVLNDLENFALGDQTEPTDAFMFDINAPGRGPIEWLMGQSDLFIGFAGGEYTVVGGSSETGPGSVGGALSASSVRAQEQSTFGSSPAVQPTIAGDSLLYTQRGGQGMRQMLFSIYTNKYLSDDLCLNSDHLFPSGIVQSAYQSRWRRQALLWAMTQQGTLCGLTYELEKQFTGWHRHVTGFGQVDLNGYPITNDNGFEAGCVLLGGSGNDDELWLVVNRLIGGVPTRMIELLNPFNWEEVFTGAPNPPAPDYRQSALVDSAQTFVSPGTRTLTGLDHLNGRLVIGLADGFPFGPIQVAAGSITLPMSIPTTVTYVSVGLPVPYVCQPMRLDADPKQGNTQGRTKQFSDIGVRVINSNGGSVSNGTANYPVWVSGSFYAQYSYVLSPLTMLAYQAITDTFGATDPSAAPTVWVNVPLPSWQPPVPIPYLKAPAAPFGAPMFVTKPTDIWLGPHLNPSPDTDPTVVIQGNDALPLTVLALIGKYEITSNP